MGGHLAEQTLLAVLEGDASVEERAHAEGCAQCQARLEEASAGLELARLAEVPEPGPFYWQSFRSQIGTRIQADHTAPRWRRLVLSPWLAVAAAAVVAVAVLLPASGPRPAPVADPGIAARMLPAWSALPPADQDPGLDLLAAVVPGVSEPGPLAECQGLGQCLGEAASLSDEDSVALEDALRRDLGADL